MLGNFRGAVSVYSVERQPLPIFVLTRVVNDSRVLDQEMLWNFCVGRT